MEKGRRGNGGRKEDRTRPPTAWREGWPFRKSQARRAAAASGTSATRSRNPLGRSGGGAEAEHGCLVAGPVKSIAKCYAAPTRKLTTYWRSRRRLSFFLRIVSQHPFAAKKQQMQRWRRAMTCPVTRRKTSLERRAPARNQARISFRACCSTAFPRRGRGRWSRSPRRGEGCDNDDGGPAAGPAHDRRFHLGCHAWPMPRERPGRRRGPGAVEEPARPIRASCSSPQRAPRAAHAPCSAGPSARRGSAARVLLRPPTPTGARRSREVVLDLARYWKRRALVRHEGEAAPRFHGCASEVEPGDLLSCPRSAAGSPARHRSVVVLPAPFGPTSPSTFAVRATRKPCAVHGREVLVHALTESVDWDHRSRVRKNEIPARADAPPRRMPRLTLQTAGEPRTGLPPRRVSSPGFRPGCRIDGAALNADLARRQHGHGRGGRMKIERDAVSRSPVAFAAGAPLGGPLAMEIANRDRGAWTDVMGPDTIDAAAAANGTCRPPPPGHADYSRRAGEYGRRDLRDILERASARETTPARGSGGRMPAPLAQVLGIEIRAASSQVGVREEPKSPMAGSPSATSREVDESSPLRAVDRSVEGERWSQPSMPPRTPATRSEGLLLVAASGEPPGGTRLTTSPGHEARRADRAAGDPLDPPL